MHSATLPQPQAPAGAAAVPDDELAALANTAVAGALVMALFALACAPGLAAAPWAWSRWQAWRGQRVAATDVAAWGYRIAGAGLVLTAAWAITFDMAHRIVVWCVG